MEIPNDFEIGDIVYLKHDIDQKPRMITELRIRKEGIAYELTSASEYSIHQGFEMSKIKVLHI
jgi:hypothetical protein